MRRRGDGKPLFAGGPVGDVAHRIDRFVGRPGGNQDPLAGKRARLRRMQEAFGGGGDFHRLRHPADTGFARLSHFAGIGSD